MRKHSDPCATGQNWYCRVCEARYKTTSGVMAQMISEGQSHFIRASFPTYDLEQMKWNCVLDAHTGAMTPEELLRPIPASLCPLLEIRLVLFPPFHLSKGLRATSACSLVFSSP